MRPNVAQSVKECYEAGIRVIMITGDYPVPAQDIARQAGIVPYDKVITGPELEKMSEAELKERIKTVCVFARVVPEQKLMIVNALKANNEIVVMTGDGVNDAPALKSANIGIAMGGRGTEVAREASALVLLDDDFSSIVLAVKMGRRIFDNIKKAFAYIFAIHVPIAGMTLIPVVLQWPIILFPVHIAFLELIIDPVCSLVFEGEREEKNIMKRKPRKNGEPLLTKKTIFLSLLQGFVMLAVVAATFYFTYQARTPLIGAAAAEAEARTLAFATMVLSNLALVLVNVSWSRSVFESILNPNKALVAVFIAALGCLALSISVPFLSQIFKFGPLAFSEIEYCVIAAVASVIWFEVPKMLNKVS